MRIYLVQPGKSRAKDVDPKRDHAEEGIAETKAIAQHAAQHDLQVQCIRQSGKKCARETATRTNFHGFEANSLQ